MDARDFDGMPGSVVALVPSTYGLLEAGLPVLPASHHLGQRPDSLHSKIINLFPSLALLVRAFHRLPTESLLIPFPSEHALYPPLRHPQ